MVKKIKIGESCEISADFDGAAWGRLNAVLSGGGKVGIACSGGADSVFLLHCIVSEFGAAAGNIVVLHYNHKVRRAADADEKFVEKECERLRVRFFTGSPKRPPIKAGEDALRALRLEFFRSCAEKFGLSAIAQGHHLGDAVESMLMRIARGSGLDGLCAPRAVSVWRGVEFVRPLLGMRKESITGALKAAKIAWREDESNFGSDFFRNRIRNAVLPEFEKAAPSDLLASAARCRRLLSEDSSALSSIFDSEFSKENGAWDHREKALLSPVILAHASFVRRAAEKFMAANGLSMRAPGVDEFVSKVVQNERCKADAGRAFLLFEPSDSSFSVLKKEPCERFSATLNFGENTLPDGSSVCLRRVFLDSEEVGALMDGRNVDGVSAYLDISALSGAEEAVARSRSAGDMYAPLGRRISRKLGYLLNAKKTPRAKRNALPVVCNKTGDILWVPTLAPADKYKITGAGEALELTFKPPVC